MILSKTLCTALLLITYPLNIEHCQKYALITIFYRFFSSVFWWQVAFPIIKNILCQQHYQITVPALFWSRNCYITLPNRNLGYCKVAWKWWTRFLGIQSACRHKTIIVPMGLCGLWWGNSLWMIIVGHIWVSVHCMNTIVIIVICLRECPNKHNGKYLRCPQTVIIWAECTDVRVYVKLVQYIDIFDSNFPAQRKIHVQVAYTSRCALIEFETSYTWGNSTSTNLKKWYGMQIWHHPIKIEILHVFIWRCIYSEICLLIYY